MYNRSLKQIIVYTAISLLIFGCATEPLDINEYDVSEDASSEGIADSGDTQGDSTEANQSNSEDAFEDDFNLDQTEAENAAKQNTEQAAEPAPAAQPANEEVFALDDPNNQSNEPVPPPSEPIASQEESPLPEALPPEEVIAPEPVASASSAVSNELRSINFKSSASGGTLILEGRNPLVYTTSVNNDNQQLLIDLPSTRLPKRLERPLIMKDFDSPIAMVTAYYDGPNQMTRVVVQLRDGASEPLVSTENNKLLVLADNGPASAVPTEADTTENDESRALSSTTLDEFLKGDTQYYGKKISIEANDMDIREALKFITEESGINLVVSDEVKGTISLRLREIPWDQALIVMMRTKRLGYIRQGNIIRVAPIKELRSEESETIATLTESQNSAPLKVRMFPISYAKSEELLTQIKPFLSDKRGQAFADPRTSALVVSDTAENLVRISQLIESIDVPPAQVLIEGKVVEARDGFKRSVGINWSASGSSSDVGSNSRGQNIRLRPSLGVSPTAADAGFLKLGFSLGTLDTFGTLDAKLALSEQEDTAKVISSPRIVALHNEQAIINQITEIPLITTTSNPTSGFTQNSVSFKSTKLSLQVTPQVTNDGNVLMAVDVNRDFLGAVSDQASGARPVNTRSAKTKVLVKNGQTAVIGGIYQTDSSETDFKVPGLGDIPIIGFLFKGKESTREKNELLIFLTPRILGQADTMGSSN